MGVSILKTLGPRWFHYVQFTISDNCAPTIGGMIFPRRREDILNDVGGLKSPVPDLNIEGYAYRF